MKRKAVSGRVEFKADGDAGQFRAVFSTLNVKDQDNDVTLPGAFVEEEKVRVSYWGHRWEDLPVGKGMIHADDNEAWVDGEFFLNTEAGRDTYETVKALGELQEWSYGYEILDAMPGKFEGEDVQFLKSLHVIEVSPVMLGAGVNTRTTDIKAVRSQKDTERVQQIHDLAVGLGAKCAEPAADDSDGDGDGDGKGKAADHRKPSSPRPRTFAERTATRLLELDVKDEVKKWI